jgi:hypothetical protein
MCSVDHQSKQQAHRAMRERPLAIDASVLNDSRASTYERVTSRAEIGTVTRIVTAAAASTSVLQYPGTIFRISQPKLTESLSSTCWDAGQDTTLGSGLRLGRRVDLELLRTCIVSGPPFALP